MQTKHLSSKKELFEVARYHSIIEGFKTEIIYDEA